jgi:pyruvate formate lyase activating enzyme
MRSVNRRQFLGRSAAMLCCAAGTGVLGPFGAAPGVAAADLRGRVFKGDAPDRLWKWSREGVHYNPLGGGRVVCGICPHRCRLSPGDRSVCRSRVNLGGKLYTLVYGNPCAVHVDPVEKKPLFHFKPRSRALSVATTGCNLRCLNCQNWEISQAKPHEVRHIDLFPEQVVAAADRAESQSIAYTYSEPVTFYEYTLDTARMAKTAGLDNLLISAGYINSGPLRELARHIDGANINLKSFEDAIYRRLNGARLKPVLNTLRALRDLGVHLEVTHLVVPGYVDNDALLARMCRWILDHLGPDVPLHFLRFFPRYKLDRLPPTPVSTLTRFRKTAMSMGIRYAYVGNVPGHAGNHTYCHSCGQRVVQRRGYVIPRVDIVDGCCQFCGTRIPGVWQ